MKIFKQTFLAIFAVAMIGIFAGNAHAQDKSTEQYRAAVKTFNKARDLAKSKDYDQAISKYKEAIDEAQGLGDKASKLIKDKASKLIKLSKKQVPGIYYQKALDDYRAFKSSQTVSNIEKSIDSFQSAADAGDQYGNQSITDKSTSNITQLMYFKSVLQFNQKKYDAALSTADQVIKRNANYAQAYYQKGLILKKQDGNFESAMAMFDKTIDVAEKNDNAKVARKAKESAAKELTYRGSKKIESKQYTTAIDYLNRALKYDPESSDAQFRLAQAYNKRSEWTQALTHGRKALKLESGGRTAKAKIYFQIATSHKGNGNFKQACDDFANASYGQFRESAQHQIKYELKCKSK